MAIFLATVLDKFGRILIPKEVRDQLGIKEGTTLEIIVKGGELIIRPHDENLEKKVREAMDYLKKNAPKPFATREEEVDGKWFSKEYSLRKIGLKE